MALVMLAWATIFTLYEQPTTQPLRQLCEPGLVGGVPNPHLSPAHSRLYSFFMYGTHEQKIYILTHKNESLLLLPVKNSCQWKARNHITLLRVVAFAGAL
jgi:hypothetical protein